MGISGLSEVEGLPMPSDPQTNEGVPTQLFEKQIRIR